VATLRQWGVSVIEPEADEHGYLRMAAPDVILAEVARRYRQNL
jgi:phosphopantothenoylcysteine synthetase/decarboxylase